MTSMINSLRDDYSKEIKSKTESLEEAQAKLRVSTRRLADQRRQVQSWQAKCNELEQVHQRIKNLELAIAEEDLFDWAGRTDLDGSPATEQSAGAAFASNGPSSSLAAFDSLVETHNLVEPAPPIPIADSPQNLVRLRRLLMWHQRADALLEGRIRVLHGASAEKELMCKKILSISTGVSVEDIEKVRVIFLLTCQ